MSESLTVLDFLCSGPQLSCHQQGSSQPIVDPAVVDVDDALLRNARRRHHTRAPAAVPQRKEGQGGVKRFEACSQVIH